MLVTSGDGNNKKIDGLYREFSGASCTVKILTGWHEGKDESWKDLPNVGESTRTAVAP